MPSINDRKTREQRKLEAEDRQAACRKLSTADRVAALDKRLGAGKGATTERMRLSIQQPMTGDELTSDELLREIFDPAHPTGAAEVKKTRRGRRG